MDPNDNPSQPEHTSPAPSPSDAQPETRPAPAEPSANASTTQTDPPPPHSEDDAGRSEPTNTRPEHEAHFLNFLSLLMPMMPSPLGAQGPAPAPGDASMPSQNSSATADSNGLPLAPGGAESAPGEHRPPGHGRPPRDSVFVFLNFGPSNPATSSNPAKAKEMIDSLPAVNEQTLRRVDAVVRAESGEDDGWNCGICLESDGAVKALPCNHLFHSACLEPWFATHLTCPTCRMQLDPLNTLSNHERPARTRTMRPTASGSNTPSARSTPYPARSPLQTPQPEREMMTTTIIFGGPFHSSPAPLGTEPLDGAQASGTATGESHSEVTTADVALTLGSTSAAPEATTATTNAGEQSQPPESSSPSAQPARDAPPSAPVDSPMQTDTPPPNAMPRFMFFGNPGMAGTPPAGAGTEGEPQQPRIIFFGEPPGGDHPHMRFPFPSQPQGVNAPEGDNPAAAEGDSETRTQTPNLFGPPPADGQPRFHFNFRPPRPPAPEPAAPPRKTITLHQWLHVRERMLGWRCDGPICGVAPSEDDPDSDGKPTSSEKTVAIYSPNQPYFTPPPPDAPPRPEDFMILACSHRWHRSCLEIAARSDGYWRIEGERVWVRCMACRHEGWVHAGVDETQSDNFEADRAAVENCT